MFGGLVGWHLLLLVGMLVVPLLIVGVVIGMLRRRRAAGDDESRPVVSLTLSLAALWALISAITAVAVLLSTLWSPEVTLAVPVVTYWPLPMPGVTVEGGPATVSGGGFTSAELTLTGVSAAVRWLWGLGSALGILVPGTIAGLIALLCFQLLAGRAFAPLAARAAMITAVVVLVGGLGSGLLCGIAGSIASREALEITGASSSGYPDDFDIWTFLPQPTWSLQIDFWPIGAALAFAAFAALLRYGARLERDTDLLV